MKLQTRTLTIAGITREPDETWMIQIAGKLTAAVDGFLHDMQQITLDRDPLYTTAFRRLLRNSGITFAHDGRRLAGGHGAHVDVSGTWSIRPGNGGRPISTFCRFHPSMAA